MLISGTNITLHRDLFLLLVSTFAIDLTVQ